MTTPAYCGCGHHESRHHPAGRCAVTLPPFDEEELPAWSCPCRRYKAEPGSLALLRSVQSCTVGRAARPADQCVCPARCAAHPFSVLGRVTFAGWGG